MFVGDGRQVALIERIDHWEMSRRLLAEVRPRLDRPPAPGRDADVRRWYIATSAFHLERAQIELAHFAEALRIFPEDADVLFLAGSMRELATTPGIYETLRRASGPRGTVMELGSEEKELRAAEALLRRSLSLNPNHIEARLRLGRVLQRLGQLDEAIRELTAMTVATNDSLLLYYASMFLGAALDARGDMAGARSHYERAQAIFPSAQSPRVAISQLIVRQGDRAAALDYLKPALSRSAIDAADPIWMYHSAGGRHSDDLMRRMYSALSPAVAP